MRTYRMKCFAGMFLAAALALGASTAAAQFEMLGAFGAEQPGQTVAGMGTSSVSRPPEVLRMYVELTAKAATLEEALASLKERREAALLQLKMLKADMDTVETGAPGPAAGPSAERRQMEQMVLQRMRGAGRRLPPGLDEPEPVAVAMRLQADWPLTADSPEELLLRSDAIRKQVKEADLAGSAEEEEVSPEMQEMLEEMAGMQYDYNETPFKEGEPVFLFVARIDEADRRQAMSDAFAKARGQAQSLTEAAGVELGPLVSLAGYGGGQSSLMDNPYGYEYQAYMQRVMGRSGMGGIMSSQQNASEAMSTTPEDLSFTFMVRAYFALAPSK